jgi:hypothetical protein
LSWQAGIDRVVAVVACFCCVDDAVTASRSCSNLQSANRIAHRAAGEPIRAGLRHDVSVVTFLEPLHKAITTAGDAADVRAVVCVHPVAVVAGLASLYEAVAAVGRTAQVAAAIGIDGVRVVTLLPRLHEAVAAAGAHTTRQAEVCVGQICVVALL